ncbi:glycosyltransferase family 2 protein [Rhodobacterales bacterium HKCCSP123]|nr:glycosyltransferase family 2 protein [Rhodobacterales bacterium HKCCSP123]
MKVISLTSIPRRFAGLGQTLESLVAQEADQVRLYIPRTYRRFPDWDGSLPSVPSSVQIFRCDRDLGPATKILPACKDLRGRDAQILLCDDDGIFSDGWADRLFKIQAERPSEVVAGYARAAEGYVPNPVTLLKQPRLREIPIRRDIPYRFGRLMHKVFGMRAPLRRPIGRAGYGEVFFGVAGAVVRPEFFDDVAYDIPEEAWAVDDVWLSAQLARRGIPIFCPRRHPMPKAADHASLEALADLELEAGRRQDLNRLAARYCQEQFGVWLS